jgi:hypothetical protein
MPAASASNTANRKEEMKRKQKSLPTKCACKPAAAAVCGEIKESGPSDYVAF